MITQVVDGRLIILRVFYKASPSPSNPGDSLESGYCQVSQCHPGRKIQLGQRRNGLRPAAPAQIPGRVQTDTQQAGLGDAGPLTQTVVCYLPPLPATLELTPEFPNTP